MEKQEKTTTTVTFHGSHSENIHSIEIGSDQTTDIVTEMALLAVSAGHSANNVIQGLETAIEKVRDRFLTESKTVNISIDPGNIRENTNITYSNDGSFDLFTPEGRVIKNKSEIIPGDIVELDSSIYCFSKNNRCVVDKVFSAPGHCKAITQEGYVLEVTPGQILEIIRPYKKQN